VTSVRGDLQIQPMKSFLLSCALLTFLSVTSAARAGHQFICTDSYAGKVCVVSTNTKVEWEHACKHPQDCWRLPNGNYLFCHSGDALETTPDKKAAWELQGAGENGSPRLLSLRELLKAHS
jgi:hypothetical protein